jgi:DNA (cytosine-5)-methyltransferase 1
MDEMSPRPPVLVAENVTGLVSMHGGEYYRILHRALQERGYRAGAVVLDAARWVPQSRKRVFIVAVDKNVDIPVELLADGPNWAHSVPLVKAVEGLKDYLWWSMPEPSQRKIDLSDIMEWDVPSDEPNTTETRLKLIPKAHREKLESGAIAVAPGYKRTRNGRQVLELRFDGIAGCLRTAEGGSSRQFVVLKKGKRLDTRLLTVRETARLMGAPDSFRLPGSYNDGYTAMGDAVALPVSRYLAKHLLEVIAENI